MPVPNGYSRFYEQIETNIFARQISAVCANQDQEHGILDFVCQYRSSGIKILKYGIRKIRVPLKGRGKRGGGRVVYYYQNEISEYVLFLMIFSKNERETLSPSQEEALIKEVEMFLKARR